MNPIEALLRRKPTVKPLVEKILDKKCGENEKTTFASSSYIVKIDGDHVDFYTRKNGKIGSFSLGGELRFFYLLRSLFQR